MEARELGQWGEKQAARYLRRKGYSILECNYSCRFGEIDIIAEKKNYVIFAEVKLRKNDEFAKPREFVTRAKQQRIISTAQLWLMENSSELQPRFDVIEVYAPSGIAGRVRIEHIEDAFE